MAISLLDRGIAAAMTEIPVMEYALDEAKRAMDTPAGACGALLTIIKP
jgi:hypothetical protein